MWSRVCLMVFLVVPVWGAEDLDFDRALPRRPKDRKVEALKELPRYKEILEAIEKGQAYLIAKQQEDGSWPEAPHGQSGPMKIGPTCLSALALIKSGMSNRDKIIEKAMAYIKTTRPDPKYTYEATSLLMLLEAYGKVYKRGKEPKGPKLYREPESKKKKKKKPKEDWVFDAEIKAWMETLVRKIESSGATWETKWPIPKPKSKRQVEKRFKKIMGEKGASRYGRKKSSFKYKIRPKDDFKVWRWQYYVHIKTKSREQWDTSNLQYVYLGLKAAVRVGLDVENRDLWYGSLLHWLETQEPDGPEVELWNIKDRRPNREVDPYNLGKGEVGYEPAGMGKARGWGYREQLASAGDVNPQSAMKGRPRFMKPTAPLTPAGISSLLLIRSVLFKDADYLAYFEDDTEKAITDGYCWLDHHWDHYLRSFDIWWGHYSYYGVERVGVFGGTETIGKHYWYNELSDKLLGCQQDDGHFKGMATPGMKTWDQTTINICNTAWSLLVLSRGSEPIKDAPKPSYAVGRGS